MTSAAKIRRFGRDIKEKSKIMSLEVDRQNISREYDQWVVETQLCKLRNASDTFIGRACAIFHFLV